MLITVIVSILAITRGDKSITEAILDISTVNFWLNHQGAWFIAMLIPLYALVPLHNYLCNQLKNPLFFNLVTIALIVCVSCISINIENIAFQRLIDNVRFVIFHLPAFYVGFMLAPFAKNGKQLSWFWIIVAPVIIVTLLKILRIGYWPGFLFLPFTGICCVLFRHFSENILQFFDFFGKISLESYLINGSIGSCLIAYFPMIYESALNKGCYLHYSLVIVLGTLLAYAVHELLDRLYFKRINTSRHNT